MINVKLTPLLNDHTKAKLSGQQDQCMNKSPAAAAAVLEYYHQCNKDSGGSVSISVDTINSSAVRELPSATDFPTHVLDDMAQSVSSCCRYEMPISR
ncbi:unnamed protein product [Onchocerca ochengi]|uniref:SCP domain-containing protein n=1 Tax=Onchocerca ochengi TaxID=42157 RepID=A0A182DXK8_ONCOC|nr:unnamed protein product [Onchocerca ochengi]